MHYDTATVIVHVAQYGSYREMVLMLHYET